jgi:hypothetical protein
MIDSLTSKTHLFFLYNNYNFSLGTQLAKLPNCASVKLPIGEIGRWETWVVPEWMKKMQ